MKNIDEDFARYGYEHTQRHYFGQVKNLYICKSSLFPQEYYGIPGLVAQMSDSYAVVTCGKGAIYLHEVRLDSSTKEVATKVLKYGMRLK